MALKKEVLQQLAALAKLKVEDLEAAIKDEKEVDIEIEEGLTVFSEAEVTTLKENEFKRGKTVSLEIAVKDAKEKHGLEFTGKALDSLIDAYGKKVIKDAKIEPGKKEQELTDKITNLQKTVTEYETKIAAKDKEVAAVKINGELFKHIPAPGENGPLLGQDDVIQLMKANGYQFDLAEDGKITISKDGKQILDKTSNPVPVGDVVTGFMKEKKLITEAKPTPGGRGAGDGKPGTKTGKMSDLKKQFEAEGKSLLGAEFSQAVAAAVKDNPDFDMEA